MRDDVHVPDIGGGVLLQRLLAAPGQPGDCAQAPRHQQTALLTGNPSQPTHAPTSLKG